MVVNERRRQVEAGIRLEPLTHARGAGESGETTIAAALARHRVPGCAVAVIADGRLDWAAGYGITEAGQSSPVSANTIFQACSISKPVAAVAALRLVQEGRLDLDEDVNSYLTTWRVPANGDWQPRVTLRQLLSHTAGLTYFWFPGYPRGAPLPTTVQTLRGEPPANTPPVRATAIPGAQFRYAGAHYAVLQQLLEDVTGRPFAALLRDLVFAPLGMADSGYETDFPVRHGGATAAGHDAGGFPIAGGWRVLPESAGAGLWTTPGDLCRLMVEVCAARAGRSERLLSQETARAMLTPQVGGRGLGWSLATIGGQLRFAHGGSNIGYKCLALAWPDSGVGAAVMTNGDEGDALVRDIIRAVARVYGWVDPVTGGERLTEVVAVAPGVLGRYAGEYGGGRQALYRVAVADGALALTVGAQPALTLRPLSATTFVADAVNAEVTFAAEGDGPATGFTLIQDEDDLTVERSG